MKKILIVSLMAILLLTLTACGKGSEKDRFINASVEVGCAMFKDENFFNDFSKVEAKTKEIFTKYDFNVDDEKAMSVISEKYQEDPEVLAGVQDGITKCAGNIFNKQILDQAATLTETTTEIPAVETK